MPRPIRLHIPEQCHESWQEMTPESDGRFCGSCKKTVVDFTAMSDSELARWFASYEGNACGRFAPHQLGRPLSVPRKPLPWLRAFFTITLPALFFTTKATAQGRMQGKVRVQQVASHPAAVPTAATPALLELTMGRILDVNDAPVPFATVAEKGTNNSVTADANGRFTIRAGKKAKLVISSVGFESKEVANKRGDTALLVRMERAMLMGEVVVVSQHDLRRAARKQTAQTPSINVYPNPCAAGTTLNISSRNLPEGAYRTELVTPAGQPVRSDDQPLRDRMLHLTTVGLLPGTYTLVATHQGTGKRWSQQVVLQP